MPSTIDIHDARALELQARSLDALVSLLHALNASSDVDDVAQRALLTLSGQMLVQRAAFFVVDGDLLRLRATVGIGKNRVTPPVWRLPDAVSRHFEDPNTAVVDLAALKKELVEEISGSFDRLARLSNGEDTVGVVLLGGWLGTREINDADRQLLRTMGVVIGTTLHRVTVQRDLQQANRRLEQAQLIRRTVMDHVSHEFNTPLMVVKSIGELLPEAPPQDWEGLLHMHGESVERLEYLVESILSVAHSVEGGNRTQRLSVPQVIDQVVRPWWIQWARRGADLVTAEPANDAFVLIDHTRLEMILDTLHSNSFAAIDADHGERMWTNVYVAPSGWWVAQKQTDRLLGYRDAEGKVSDPMLGCDPIVVDDGEAMALVVEVVDLGCGIPEDDLQEIFEPFVQASNSARLGISGAGMGLPTARRLAEELGGNVVLQSAQGEGTLAALILPLSDQGISLA